MVDLLITKSIDANKFNKFICLVEMKFSSKRFSYFINNERANKHLHYHIKNSNFKSLLKKNPITVSIVEYKGNTYRESLKPFIRNEETFEFSSKIERDFFYEAIKQGLEEYFEYAEELYERNE
ncbi:hypothetical protein BC30048_p2047 (plasmid) [Bacillus cereus]|uniref:hypothetical protein n=1 Tax=Bacillus cereus TaxID=1396 RepID=UPI001F1E7759|nr:hypothetical protein [Bacillus cereus]BCC15035.1 hypothetical protein BCM0074_p1039 [Bacillus cereus]BCD02872.1 hypothetical protein BC30048_p2047 [Bacillus cereus]